MILYTVLNSLVFRKQRVWQLNGEQVLPTWRLKDIWNEQNKSIPKQIRTCFYIVNCVTFLSVLITFFKEAQVYVSATYIFLSRLKNKIWVNYNQLYTYVFVRVNLPSRYTLFYLRTFYCISPKHTTVFLKHPRNRNLQIF